MTKQEILVALPDLIEQGREHDFYCSATWEQRRRKVLKLDRYECQHCKKRGRYAPAVIVHHVQHLKDRPDLALSVFNPDTGERQLVSLCKACHEREHPERLASKAQPARPPITAERWD